MESFDLVCCGGGVAAGYWTEALVEELNSSTPPLPSRPSILIISGEVDGLLPFERPALSKGLLAPNAVEGRDFQGRGTAFPFTSAGSGRPPRGAKWYQMNNIKVWHGCQCENIDAAAKTLTVAQRWEGRRVVEQPRVKTARYGTLLVATGCSPRTLKGGIVEPCSCIRHPDMSGTARLDNSAKDRYGLGSVHYLRDLGDTAKLVRAFQATWPVAVVPKGEAAPEPEEWANDVVIVGGGFIALEAAAAIASHYPSLRATVVLSGPHLMGGFLTPEMAGFYESRLASRGVRFLRGYVTEKLWPVTEDGTFKTPDGPANFSPVPAGFVGECRGVVMRPRNNGIEVRLPARMVIVAIGAIPNTEPFRQQLAVSPVNGGVEVDIFLRTSAPGVFAAGDVASFPLALEGGKRVRHEHVQCARDTARLAARNMLRSWISDSSPSLSKASGGVGSTANQMPGTPEPFPPSGSPSAALEPFTPVPSFYSRSEFFSWRFFGVPDGEVAVMGLAPSTSAGGSSPSDSAGAAINGSGGGSDGNGSGGGSSGSGAIGSAREHAAAAAFWAAFWVREKRVVGAFLEGGTAEQQQVLEQIARERPRVFSANFLKKTSLEEFLEDPGKLEADDSDVSQLLMCCRCI